MSQPQDLPPFIKRGNFEEQENFFELFFAILQSWFNSNGFYLPTLTSTQVTALVAQYGSGPWPIKLWYNSTNNVLQFLDATGAVQTITSS